MSCPIQLTYSTAENFIQPTLVYNKKSKLYDLVDTYVFEWGTPFNRQRLTRVAPYEYDKASVPRFLQGLARSDGPWDGPSLLHDNLYQFEGTFNGVFYHEFNVGGVWKKSSRPWTREQADALLQYTGQLGGASKFTAWLYKMNVRAYPPNWFKGF